MTFGTSPQPVRCVARSGGPGGDRPLCRRAALDPRRSWLVIHGPRPSWRITKAAGQVAGWMVSRVIRCADARTGWERLPSEG